MCVFFLSLYASVECGCVCVSARECMDSCQKFSTQIFEENGFFSRFFTQIRSNSSTFVVKIHRNFFLLGINLAVFNINLIKKRTFFGQKRTFFTKKIR